MLQEKNNDLVYVDTQVQQLKAIDRYYKVYNKIDQHHMHRQQVLAL